MSSTFLCLDCAKYTGKDWKDYYMVQHDLWNTHVPERDGMLCWVCMEKRLGRGIEREDLILAPVNVQHIVWKTEKRDARPELVEQIIGLIMAKMDPQDKWRNVEYWRMKTKFPELYPNARDKEREATQAVYDSFRMQ